MINLSLKEQMLEQIFYNTHKSIYEIYHPHSLDGLDKSKQERIDEVINSIHVPTYLTDRIKCTLDNIEVMLNKPNWLLPEDANTLRSLQCIIKIQYDNLKQTLDLTTNEFSTALERLSILDQFDAKAINAICQLENHYKSILSLYDDFLYKEDAVSAISLKDWKHKLTSPVEYHFGNPFYFIAHATSGNAEDVYRYTYSRSLISTSLLSNIHTSTYQPNARDYGLIYTPCLENIFLISKGDAYCDDLSLGEYHIGAEYVCKGTEISSIRYTDPSACRTYLIEQLENDHPEEYNEIVLLNNEYSRPTAVFRLESCSPEHQEQAEKLANLLHLALPLIILNAADC